VSTIYGKYLTKFFAAFPRRHSLFAISSFLGCFERNDIRAKRIHGIPQFTLYAVADGIFDILKFASKGIRFALLHPPRSQQLSLFKPTSFNLSAA
jgi:hypothetical protein